jgi:hypothetical protein
MTVSRLVSGLRSPVASCTRFLQLIFFVLVDYVIRRSNRNRHDGERRLITPLRNKGGAICNKDILYIMYLVVCIQHTFFGVAAHARRSTFVDVLAEHAQIFIWWCCILDMHGVEDIRDIPTHGFGHRVLILTMARADSQNRYTPSILRFGVKLNKIIEVWQALSLRADREVIRNFAPHFLSPRSPEARNRESV